MVIREWVKVAGEWFFRKPEDDVDAYLGTEDEPWEGVYARSPDGNTTKLLGIGNDGKILDGLLFEETTVELGGDFDAGEEVRIVRVGKTVTIQGVGNNLAHGLGDEINSASGAIPAAFRPPAAAANLYFQGAKIAYTVEVFSSGSFIVRYTDTTTGGFEDRTDTNFPPTLTYLIS